MTDEIDEAASRLIVLPHIDPARGRSEMTVAAETSVAEMVTLAFPGASHDRVRVSIGEHVIDREAWQRVRPRPGATVVIRAIPGDDTLRTVLTVAVVVAAMAVGQYYGGAIAGGLGITSAVGISATNAVVTAGFPVCGNILQDVFQGIAK